MEETQQKKQITPLILQKNTYKIIIPAKVENMIRMLCSEVHNVEWSGALFYTYTGSFESDDLVITCQDICVMDIGNGGYTEFVESPIIINYQMEHELLDCKIGLIHSHNTMATFFSSTDKMTLLEEGLSMNNFVSLIVNNDGKYTAAITRNVKAIKTIKALESYQFFGEGEVNLEPSQHCEESKEIQYFPLEICKETGANNVILSRLEEIRKLKTEVTTKPTYPAFNSFNKTTNVISTKVKEPTLFDDWEDDATMLYDNEQVDPTIVETAALQIITGSIFVTIKNKVNFKSWIKQVDTLFNNRFETFDDFKYWMESHIDAVLVTTHCEELEVKYDSDIWMSLLAHKINLMLDDYKTSKYVQEIVNYLFKYIY